MSAGDRRRWPTAAAPRREAGAAHAPPWTAGTGGKFEDAVAASRRQTGGKTAARPEEDTCNGLQRRMRGGSVELRGERPSQRCAQNGQFSWPTRKILASWARRTRRSSGANAAPSAACPGRLIAPGRPCCVRSAPALGGNAPRTARGRSAADELPREALFRPAKVARGKCHAAIACCTAASPRGRGGGTGGESGVNSCAGREVPDRESPGRRGQAESTAAVT